MSQAAGKIFDNQALKDGGFQVSRPKVVLPKVMIYDVPNDISEDEELFEEPEPHIVT